MKHTGEKEVKHTQENVVKHIRVEEAKHTGWQRKKGETHKKRRVGGVKRCKLVHLPFLNLNLPCF